MVAMKQDYSKGLMIALAIVFMAISSVFLGLRMFAKRLGQRKIGWDDHLCTAALVVCIACSILQLVAAIHGRLGQHQIVDSEGQPILDDPQFLVYEKTKFAVNILGVFGLGLIKASILLFYKSIFHVRPFKLAVHFMLGIVGMWTTSYVFANLFTCWPVTALIEPFYGNKCINAVPMWLSVVYTDIIVDVAILVMPIPMVLGLQLPMLQKVAVLAMFMLGATVCAVSITRLIVLTKIAEEFVLHYNDMTYYTSPVFFWTNIELSLAVVSACLPTLRPLWTHLRPMKQNTTQQYGDGSYRYGSGGKRSAKPLDEYTELSDIETLKPSAGIDITVTRGTPTGDDGSDRSVGHQGILVRSSFEATTEVQRLKSKH